MVTATITLLVFLGLAIAVPIGLWLLIQGETSEEEELNRESAEKLAREEFAKEYNRDRDQQ